MIYSGEPDYGCRSQVKNAVTTRIPEAPIKNANNGKTAEPSMTAHDKNVAEATITTASKRSQSSRRERNRPH